MKKGCFITGIVILTIVLGVVLYIFQNHFDSMILNPGKKWIAGIVKGGLHEELDVVVDSPEKTELLNLIEEFSKSTEKLKTVKKDEIEQLVNQIKLAVTDSIIQKSELEEIKKLLRKE